MKKIILCLVIIFLFIGCNEYTTHSEKIIKAIKNGEVVTCSGFDYENNIIINKDDFTYFKNRGGYYYILDKKTKQTSRIKYCNICIDFKTGNDIGGIYNELN